MEGRERMGEISEEDQQYMRERGFEIIEGHPPRSAHFPYMVLRKFGDAVSGPEIRFMEDHTGGAVTGIGDDLIDDKDALVSEMEKIVARERRVDGKLFSTEAGKPIRVFVADPIWMDAARTFADKYKREDLSPT